MSFVKDIGRAKKQLAALDKAILMSLHDAADAGAEVLENEARNRVPVRTGKLRDGMARRAGYVKERTAVSSAVSVVYNKVFYAAPVEFGRYKRPFMRPAIQATKGTITNAMQAKIKRSADKAL
jgi:HK97 gp10 family phage protein